MTRFNFDEFWTSLTGEIKITKKRRGTDYRAANGDIIQKLYFYIFGLRKMWENLWTFFQNFLKQFV